MSPRTSTPRNEAPANGTREGAKSDYVERLGSPAVSKAKPLPEEPRNCEIPYTVKPTVRPVDDKS